MEADKSLEADSMVPTTFATTSGRQPVSNAVNETRQQAKKDADEDENDDNSDSSGMVHPLFMNSLPKNFATNPQLAAIASLLNDDEDEVDNDTQDDQEEKDKNNAEYAHAPSDHHRTPHSTPHTTITGRWKNSVKSRNRRRQNRVSPYPQQQDRSGNKKGSAKGTSVGEITLFMNMWKPWGIRST